MDSSELRAGDADREKVAERLRIALEEGRLNLHEYDERLRDAFSSKTYADLDKLLADLPNVTPPSQQQLAVPGEAPLPAERWQVGVDGRYSNATRMWLAELWGSWLRANAICWSIWAVIGIFNDASWSWPWPVWVSVPWGIVLLFHTIGGLSGGEPQRWAAKQHRKQAERRSRKEAQRDAKEAEREARRDRAE